MGTWCEADIVGATVSNAIEQGCERVFLVDNDSSDDTVDMALASGATLARTFRTQHYDEELRIAIMNEVVADESRMAGVPHVWWLWLDADEFHHGTGRRTIAEQLSTVDRSCRVIGARCFNHFPTQDTNYALNAHPLTVQPLCEEFKASEFSHCALGHWKHPLQRWDHAGPTITSGAGFHRASCAVTLLEPRDPVILHHFPYRDEEKTRSRLDALCGGDGSERRNSMNDARVGGRTGISKRYESLTAVYQQRWSLVDNLHKDGRAPGVSPRSWNDEEMERM